MASRLPPLVPARIGNDRGAAAIEFALVLPMLCVLLFGIVGYGDWFLTAHGVQQAANDGARAAIGGLDRTERDTLAAAAAKTSLSRAGVLDPALATVAVDDDEATVVVRLSYDVSRRPLIAGGLVPTPAKTIVRSAAIRLESL
jgi:Flp pilus assembly protein TadG